ncbi:rod shape-determining protein MreD [Eremococcus coleocola ACS-139-V-Col8]|uniref:Rod shape-determining protein MreD n=2 Tax=Eremococcus TaxID=171412 RepID=E4KP39_9LACT|nr:rod shape-determining protein MreD [Eremococcus coleocola ACS-139-V-Col8]
MTVNRWRRLNWMIPIILIITSLIDNALPAIFPTAFITPNQIIISHLTLYFIILFAFYFRDSYILPYAFVFGLFYDSYNTNLLGLNATLYLVIAYIIIKVKRYLPKNGLIHAMLFIVFLTLQDFLVYLFYLELGITSHSIIDFIIMRLAPTLVFNLVVMILLFFPIKGILRWLGYEEYIVF